MDLPPRPDGLSPDDLLARADALRDGKAWADAAELYADYLRRRPDHWQIWVQYGHCTKECGDAETALHPSCTARMGVDDMAVVDPLTMRVHGTDGLSVVDASVFPFVTNGNIYAPVMMTAEKSADLILGNAPLAAEPVEFYRHGETPAVT